MAAPKGNKYAVGADNGRPTDYRQEFVEQATKLCRLGATDIELADFFGVNTSTIWRWAQTQEDFCKALKTGKELADERVERSLYAKALGYTHDAIKIFNADGTPLIVPYREHVAPDTGACALWLKNRRPDIWREKQEIAVSIEDMTEAQRREKAAEVVKLAQSLIAKKDA